MKTNWKILSIFCICLLLFPACKKSNTALTNQEQQNQDVINAKTESDNSDEDINSVLPIISAFGKNASTESINICGASIDSSNATGAHPSMTISYDGKSPCNGRIRGGQVTVQLIAGANWSDTNAELMVTYTNYKIVFTYSNNHYITFNGTKYITDVLGINWLNIVRYDSTSVQLRERTYNMTLSFDNGQPYPWNIARFSTWALSLSSVLNAYSRGDTIINGDTLDTQGSTRWGTPFTVQILQPWQSGSTCNWQPSGGKYISNVTGSGAFTITVILGVNSSGNQVLWTSCPYGFQIDWTITSGNSSGNSTLPYWW